MGKGAAVCVLDSVGLSKAWNLGAEAYGPRVAGGPREDKKNRKVLKQGNREA